MNFVIPLVSRVFKLLEAEPSSLPCLDQYDSQGEVPSLIPSVQGRTFPASRVLLHFRVQSINPETCSMVETH